MLGGKRKEGRKEVEERTTGYPEFADAGDPAILTAMFLYCVILK
jgi:hypothetical protein